MTYRYSAVSIHDSMDCIIKKMVFYGDKYIVVLEGKTVVGVITLTDVLKHLYNLEEFKCKHFAKDIMTPNPITAKKDDKCDKTATIMIKNRINVLPVVEEELEGLIRFQGFIKVLEV